MVDRSFCYLLATTFGLGLLFIYLDTRSFSKRDETMRGNLTVFARLSEKDPPSDTTTKTIQLHTVGPVLRDSQRGPQDFKATELAFWKAMNNEQLNDEEYRLRFFVHQAGARAALISDAERATNQVNKLENLYNALAPEVHCPLKLRIGRVDDGGKWLCNPRKIPKGAAIYSLGSRSDISFETQIQAITDNSSTVHTFDQNAIAPGLVAILHTLRGTFDQTTIGAYDNDTLKVHTINYYLNKYNESEIEILKIDIEGAESYVLPSFLQTNRVCQILVEMHQGTMNMVVLLRAMSRWGYYLFHFEVNGNSLTACEYSFIHKDCMEKYGVTMLAAYLGYPTTKSSFISLSPGTRTSTVTPALPSFG